MQPLSDPAVINNQDRYRELGKEHSDLSPIVQAYQSYKKAREDGENLLHLAEKSDDIEMRALANEELPEARQKLVRLEEELKNLLIPKDPLDDKDCIMEIRAGTGGEEAGAFCRRSISNVYPLRRAGGLEGGAHGLERHRHRGIQGSDLYLAGETRVRDAQV